MRKTIMLSTAVALATLTFSSSVVFAQRPGGPGRGGPRMGVSGQADGARPGRLGFGRRPGLRIAAVGRQLDLTEEQRAKIRTIMQGARTDVAPLAKDLRATMSEWRTARASGTADAARLEELRVQARATRAKIADIRAKTRPAVLEVLTPEQRQKAQEARDRRRRN